MASYLATLDQLIMKIEDTDIQERIKEYIRSMGIKHSQLNNLKEGEIETELPVMIEYNAINNEWLNTGHGGMLDPNIIFCLVSQGENNAIEITFGPKDSLLLEMKKIELIKEKERLLNEIENKNTIIEQLNNRIIDIASKN